MAATAVALIAGASGDVAARLGLGMLGLQFAIGSANDLVDARADAAVKPNKPIPAGLLSRRAAAAACASSAALGLLVAAGVGMGALFVGVAGLIDGLAYDLWLKRTPAGWVPFAAGVGLLPLYAWLGATGSVPPALAGVAALAVVAGAALALGNAYADIEADRASGIVSTAVILGPARTLAIDACLLALVQIIALETTYGAVGATPLLELGIAGSIVAWFGLGLAAVDDDRARPLVWEIQALGILILGVAWLLALSSAGLLAG